MIDNLFLSQPQALSAGIPLSVHGHGRDKSKTPFPGIHHRETGFFVILRPYARKMQQVSTPSETKN